MSQPPGRYAAPEVVVRRFAHDVRQIAAAAPEATCVPPPLAVLAVQALAELHPPLARLHQALARAGAAALPVAQVLELLGELPPELGGAD